MNRSAADPTAPLIRPFTAASSSRPIRWGCRAALVFCLPLLARADVRTAVNQPAPDQIRPYVVVLPADWAARIPPSGPVNFPAILSSAGPGQRIALGVLAQGPDREHLFDRVRAAIRFSVGGAAARDLKPVAVRRIKAQGADFAVEVLRSIGVSKADQARLEAATTLTTLAVFAPEWTVPPAGQATGVEIRVRLSGTARPVTLEPAHLQIRTVADWLHQPPLTSDELGKQLNRYHGGMAPGQLLAWFVAAERAGNLTAPPVAAYFAYAFRSDPLARSAAVEAYPRLDPAVQAWLLEMLRLGGQDLSRLFPRLPAPTLAPFASLRPLADPRKLLHFRDPVEPQAVSRLGFTMDLCWGGWMATGDKSYLRALVDLLAGGPDYKAYMSWKAARGGAKGLNARVARGIAYQIAGWSIGSFQRADPLVADWLEYWQKDPAVAPALRREITSLPFNPAFRRK